MIRAKKMSCANLAYTHERFELSKKGKINKQAMESPIAIAPPILLGIDFKIA
jgi:hypothetical protein